MQFVFPPDFLWGSSISSYQTEGDNFNTDWYQWEKKQNLVPAGQACRHYSLFEEDFAIASELSQNAFRLSLEWARIQVDSESFSDEQLAHYTRVIAALRRYRLKPVVTLHHFTNPLWFMDKGGWEGTKNIDFFLAYVREVIKVLGGYIDYWIVLNEPLVYIYNGFIHGTWPPGVFSSQRAKKVFRNLLAAYLTAYQEIKRAYPHSQVSIAKHIRLFQGCLYRGAGATHVLAGVRSYLFNHWFLEACMKTRSLDFLGINYYCKEYVALGGGLFGQECKQNHHRERTNSLGWKISAEGFLKVLTVLSRRYRLPMLITENGTSEHDTVFYRQYMTDHIKAVAKALQNKVDIRGYFWWSLLDNFEWALGYRHHFGLVEVDPHTCKRTIKPFAYQYKQICEQNGIVI